jgi:6-phosphogluconolactonase
MTPFELIQFESDQLLAEDVARRWLAALEPGSEKQRPTLVALSGGRIARRLFSSAAAAAADKPAIFSGVHFFWGDERCVPPGDPESNFGIAQALLFQPLRIENQFIHRIQGELPPETAAAAAVSELCRIAPRNSAGQPVLDLVFLGMGEDGHVASLFPGEREEVLLSDAIFRPVTATKPPPHRITLGLGVLAAAREVWVLASGSGKEEALRNSLSPKGATPLARLLHARSQTTIFTNIL